MKLEAAFSIASSSQREAREAIEGGHEDRILLGQPGSGKTRILSELARARGCALISEDNFEETVERARRQPAPLVLVDDGFFKPALIERLARERSDRFPDLRIVSSGWPSQRLALRSLLGGGPVQEVLLEGWSRREIRAVFVQAGVSASDTELALLQRGAANNPGRALSLLELWQREEWSSGLEGRSSARLLAGLECGVGSSAVALLGVLGLGGIQGTDWRRAAAGAHLDEAEAEQALLRLASAGFIEDTSTGRLVVYPPELRTLARFVPALSHLVPPSERLDVRPAESLRLFLTSASSARGSRDGVSEIERWLLGADSAKSRIEELQLVREEIESLRAEGFAPDNLARVLALTLFPRALGRSPESSERLGGFLLDGWERLAAAMPGRVTEAQWEIWAHLLGLWWERSRRASRGDAQVWRTLARRALEDLAARELEPESLLGELKTRARDFGLDLDLRVA